MKEDAIKNEILQGLRQVNSTFTLTAFTVIHDSQTRKSSVYFTATADDGTTISEVKEYD